MWPRSDSAPITALRAQAYRVPTDFPEADGTFQWNATTLVLAHVEATGVTGIGFTYADASIASFIDGVLLGAIKGRNAFDIPGCWMAMYRAVRNLGRSGLAACAISAVDTALWDLKARVLGLPLASLLGRCRDRVPDLRQWRLYKLYRRPTLRATGWMGTSRRLSFRQNENRQRAGA